MHDFLHEAFPGIFQVIISNGMVPEKINLAQKTARKVDFSEPRLLNAPSLRTVGGTPTASTELSFAKHGTGC